VRATEQEIGACARAAWGAYVEHLTATRGTGAGTLPGSDRFTRDIYLAELAAGVIDGADLEVVHRLLQRAVWSCAEESMSYASCSAIHQARVRLVANVVRTMAASLRMVVRYADGTEIDWACAVDMGRAPMAVAL